MTVFARNKARSEPAPARQDAGARVAPAADCAIWNDVVRALDLPPLRVAPANPDAESGR